MQTNILVVRFGSLGDVILTSATVLNLKLAYPGSHLVYLTKERFRSVVALFDGVDEIVTVAEHVSIRELSRVLLELDRRRFETVVDLHGNFRAWLACSMVTANQICRCPKNRFERWRMTLRRKRLPDQTSHTVDRYNETIRQLGRRAVCRRPILRPPPIGDQHSVLFDIDHPVVLIAPGAAHPNKAWPGERFVEVARALSHDCGARVIWALTSGDPNLDMFVSQSEKAEIGVLLDCPVDQLAAIIARSHLVIANDSGVGHLASAVGTSTLAIFGPTHPALGFAPRGLRDHVVQVDESCRPCSLHGRKACYRDERFCFTRISPDQVAHQAAAMLSAAVALTPALFVDRDGTLIKNKHYLSDPAEVELIDGAAEALKQARQLGRKVVVVTNQSGVARGYHSIDDVERVNGRMLELLAAQGADVDAVYYCPHHERKGRTEQYKVACDCRKPAAGMCEAAALELGIDLRKSVVVGDSMADVNLGRVIGGRSIQVRTGYGEKAQHESPEALERLAIPVVDNIGQGLRRLSDE